MTEDGAAKRQVLSRFYQKHLLILGIAWLIEAGITAKRDFFQQVNTTVGQIRALRAQVQSLALQAKVDALTEAPAWLEGDTSANA